MTEEDVSTVPQQEVTQDSKTPTEQATEAQKAQEEQNAASGAQPDPDTAHLEKGDARQSGTDGPVDTADKPQDEQNKQADPSDQDAEENQAAQDVKINPDAVPESGKTKEKKEWFKGKAREVEGLKAKLETAEKNSAALKEQLMRTAAEFDNYRKRTARESDRKFNDGISYAVTQILPILDTLEMAANVACSDENYKKGVMMTLEKASQALAKLHIEEMDVLGKPFDPGLMNAVQQVPAAEGQESGTVVQVYQKGYTIGDKIIRHASVVVAQ